MPSKPSTPPGRLLYTHLRSKADRLAEVAGAVERAADVAEAEGG